MEDRIRCPRCGKMNDRNKFCVYCGGQLLDDEEIELINHYSNPHCLNCARPVEIGQKKCECGYELANIRCPDCLTPNAYANRYCISCGKPLWSSEVDHFRYSEVLFKSSLLKKGLPRKMQNTSLYKRIGMPELTEDNVDCDVHELSSRYQKVSRNLKRISSRWKVVSPLCCISCLKKTKLSQGPCPNCGTGFAGPDLAGGHVRTRNTYYEPRFDIEELKWTSKFSDNYFGSLSPAVDESQFEYRERLKWEFAENTYLKKTLDKAISLKNRIPRTVITPGFQGRREEIRVPHVDDSDVLTESFPYQFQDFSEDVRDLCRENGGDVRYFNKGIVGCPKCSKYFHYLSARFIKTHRCPHCGLEFGITAEIYEYEYDTSGVSYDEYMGMYYDFP